MKNMINKIFLNKNVSLMILLLVGFVGIVGTSLAIFVFSDIGNRTSSITTGQLKIVLDEGTPGIDMQKAIPMEDSDGKKLKPYTFTLENTGTMSSYYTVGLVNDDEVITINDAQDNLVDYSKIKVQLNDSEPVLLSSLTNLELETGVISEKEIKSFQVRMWIDWNAGNEIMNQELYLKVKVTATQGFNEPDPVPSNDFCFEFNDGVIIDYYYGNGGSLNTYGSYYGEEYNECVGDVVVPSEIDGVPVTHIGNSAFSGEFPVSSLVLPETIVSIGDYAFYNHTIDEIIIPDSVISIGENAFYASHYCSVQIGNNVETIGSYAFPSITGTLIIPESVQEIGSYAFSLSNGSNGYIFGKSDETDFSVYTSTSITNSSATSYLKYIPIFDSYSYSYTFSNGYILDFDYSLYSLYYSEILKEVVPDTLDIPSSFNGVDVKYIGDYAFDGAMFTSIVIPDTVIEIGNSSFWDCPLSSVSLPDSLISIGSRAFGATNLTAIEIPNTVTYIGASAFTRSDLKSVIIPDGITTISAAAFSYNDLVSVTIPDTVTVIGNEAFFNNDLVEFILPAGIVNIGENAFKNNLLESINLPSGLTSIGEGVFDSNKLTSVTIPHGVTEVDTYAFRNNQLVSISLPDTLETIGYGAFSNNNLSTVTIPDSVSSMSYSVFEDNQLTNVTLSNNLTVINNYAFANNQLESVIIPDGVTTINRYAFSNNQLESVTIPDGVTTINRNAFSNNQLTSVVLPDTLETIHAFAFRYNKLTTVTIPSSVNIIWEYVFANNLLTEIIIEGKSSLSDFSRSEFKWYGDDVGILVFNP